MAPMKQWLQCSRTAPMSRAGRSAGRCRSNHSANQVASLSPPRSSLFVKFCCSIVHGESQSRTRSIVGYKWPEIGGNRPSALGGGCSDGLGSSIAEGQSQKLNVNRRLEGIPFRAKMLRKSTLWEGLFTGVGYWLLEANQIGLWRQTFSPQ